MSASSETLNNYDEDQDIIELHAAIKVYLPNLPAVKSIQGDPK